MSADLTLAADGLPPAIRFVLVNNRVPRTDQHCALCGGLIEKGYVRDSRTRVICCGVQCFAGWAHNLAFIAKNRGMGVEGANSAKKFWEDHPDIHKAYHFGGWSCQIGNKKAPDRGHA
jgi:hypothetical protein